MKHKFPETRAYPKNGGYKFVKKGEKGFSKAPLFVTATFHPNALKIVTPSK